MRRAKSISIPLLAGAALGLMAGCRRPEMQRCVDQLGNVAPENLCREEQQQSHPFGYVPLYRFYYGGWGSYDIGSRVDGGSFTPVPGARYSTTRGGFGSAFHGESGEASGHGGSGGGE
jgi:hypothetical protein